LFAWGVKDKGYWAFCGMEEKMGKIQENSRLCITCKKKEVMKKGVKGEQDVLLKYLTRFREMRFLPLVYD
jgi:hypothetical protein